MVDHTLFRPDAIDPETSAFNADLKALLAQAPSAMDVPVEETRAGDLPDRW